MRHAETDYNAAGILNGDPDIPVRLTARGRAACAALRPQLAAVSWGAFYVSRFPRTRETLDELVPDHGRARVVADFDDIGLGELEGRPHDDYVAWRRAHDIDEAPPGGESRIDALVRYLRGYELLVGERRFPALVIAHDQTIRYLLNAAAGENPIRGAIQRVPNATLVPLTRATVVGALSTMATALAAYGR